MNVKHMIKKGTYVIVYYLPDEYIITLLYDFL